MAPYISFRTAFSPNALGMNLEPPAFFQEQPLEEIRGPERAPVGDREAQVRDAGLEVVREARHGVWQLALVVGDQAVAQLAGDRPGRRLVAGPHPFLELRPGGLGHLDHEVAHPVYEAALAGRAREALLGGADDPRRAVGHHQKRVAEAPRPHILEEGAHGLDVLARAGHQVQEHLAAVARDAPGGEHRLARLAGPQPLGDAVDEQIDDVVLGQVAAGERLVLGPQPLAQLADRGPAEQRPAVAGGEHGRNVAGAEPAREQLDRQVLERLGPPLQARAQHRAERLGPVGPSAVLRRPMR
jgi:hypothetical protein